MHLDQGNQSGGDQQFIGDGVQEHTHRRDLIPAPGEVAVQQIGERRREENGQRDHLAGQQPWAKLHLDPLLHQDRDQERDEEDPKKRQRVRDIHRLNPSIPDHPLFTIPQHAAQ